MSKKQVAKKAAARAKIKKAATKKTAKKKTAVKTVNAPSKKPVAKAGTVAESTASGKKKATRRRTKIQPASLTVPYSAQDKAAAGSSKNKDPLQKLQQFEGFSHYVQGKKEPYMSETMKDHFRHILNCWCDQLMKEVDRTVDHMKDEASSFADPNDRATQEEEFALELRTRDRERQLIRKINNTLERIDRDDYGWCDYCGTEIGIYRLEARPTANLCIDCKTLDEIKEKQTKA